MTQKQYEEMRTIMQFGRLFADAMRRAMENACLLDQDFELHVDIHKIDMDHRPNDALIESVEITKCVSRNDDWQNDRMADFKFVQEGWIVNADPVIKGGVVPPTVRTMETASRVFESRKTVQKETPPDGLWISRFDDPYPMDSGVSVNE